MQNFQILNEEAITNLLTEPNSSKYAIDAHNRGIKKISIEISKFPKIKSIDLSFNELNKIEHLGTLKELKELKIYNNKLQSLIGIENITELEVLYAHQNKIEEIHKDVSKLNKLKILRLDGNRIRSIENINCFKFIQSLDLSNNRISCLKGLDGFIQLEYLNISGNQISSLQELPRLPKLEEFNISDNKIHSLIGIDRIFNLRILNLNTNNISTLSHSGSLKQLTELYLDNNKISDISPLIKFCPKIDTLSIQNNSLRQIQDLECLNNFTEGPLEDIWINGNPFSLSSTYEREACLILINIITLNDCSRQEIIDRTELDSKRSIKADPNTRLKSSSAVRPNSSRPGSTNSSRPKSSGGKDINVLHRPSSRAGFQSKYLTTEELDKNLIVARERCKNLRNELNETTNEHISNEKFENIPSEMIKQDMNLSKEEDNYERPEIDEIIIDNINKSNKNEKRDFGTYPLEQISLHSNGKHHSKEIMVSSSTTSSVEYDNQMVEKNKIIDNNPEKDQTIESIMKFHLKNCANITKYNGPEEISLENINLSENNNENKSEDEDKNENDIIDEKDIKEKLETKKIFIFKRQAESRTRPTEKEKIGYRKFRLPKAS